MKTRSVIRSVVTYATPGRRSLQEDFVLACEDKKIFMVADGFGGPESGLQAAKTACEAVKGFLYKEACDLDATLPFVLRSYFSLVGNVLFNALIHANRKVAEFNRDKNVHEKGGASVLAGFMDDDLLALANVGSCTAWMFRGGESVELMAPRTYARLCDPFSKNTQEELRVPLMAVGLASDLEPEIAEYRVQTGDWVLLQTDGLESSTREGLLAIQNQELTIAEMRAKILLVFKDHQYSDNVAGAVIIF